MLWPLSQDYNEAIQSPAVNFADADLQRGGPAVWDVSDQWHPAADVSGLLE
ncbi:MAG TPA: hypothetical protein VMS17_26155 [Gemmataceae bacterium]|nr:hypothetical protein [Gemmataceae bacterium]